MLEELFGLERFNLQGRTSLLSRENELTLSGVNGQLEQMEGVSELHLKELSRKQAAAGAKQEELQGLLKGKEAEENELSRLAGLAGEYKTLAVQREVLREKAAEADRREEAAERLEELRSVFALPLERLKEGRDRLSLLSGELEKAKAGSDEAADRRQRYDEAAGTFAGEYAAKERLQQDRESARILGELREKEERQEALQKERAKQDHLVEALKEKKAAQEESLKGLKTRLEELRKSLPPSAARAGLQRWLDESVRLNGETEKNSGILLEMEEELQKIEKTLLERVEKSPYTEGFQIFSGEKTLWLESSDLLDSLEREVLKRRDFHRDSQRQALLGERLAELASRLEPGQPCPLCGSRVHPAPEHSAAPGGAAPGAGDPGDDPDFLWEEFGRFRGDVELIRERRSSLILRMDTVKSELSALEREAAGHRSGFSWFGFASGRPEEDVKILEEFHIREEAVRGLESELAREEEARDGDDILEAESRKAGRLAEEAAGLAALTASLREAVPRASREARAGLAADELSGEVRRLDALLEELEEKKAALETEEKALLGVEAAAIQRLTDLQSRTAAAREALAEQERELGLLMDDAGITGVETLEKDLQSGGSVKEERREIRRIREEAAAVEERTLLLEKELAGFSYSEPDHQVLRGEIDSLREENELLIRRTGELAGAVRELTGRLKEKKKLLQEKERAGEPGRESKSSGRTL